MFPRYCRHPCNPLEIHIDSFPHLSNLVPSPEFTEIRIQARELRYSVTWASIDHIMGIALCHATHGSKSEISQCLNSLL